MKLNDMGTFFLQIPPGLESIGKRELIAKAPIAEEHVSQVIGGLSIQCTFEVALRLNRTLKIPNRILLRLLEFKCRDLPKLFNKVSKGNYKFFNANQDFHYSITSHSSRLFDARKIEKTLKEAFHKSHQAFPPKKKESEKLLSFNDWTIFCRFENDLCTLSLDLSGERLGKRGYKKSSGLAPMRENLAAAMWYFLSYDLEDKENLTVIDPFAGSGTMLFEASLFNLPTTTRQFCGDTFLYGINDECKATHTKTHLIALEQNSEQIKCLKLNNERLHLNLMCHEISNLNFNFDTLPEQTILFTNPPYNKRVSGSDRLWKKNLKVKRIGLVLPEEEFPKIENYRTLRKLSFKHGGKNVVFKVLVRD